jgi:hypothetical protein
VAAKFQALAVIPRLQALFLIWLMSNQGWMSNELLFSQAHPPRSTWEAFFIFPVETDLDRRDPPVAAQLFSPLGTLTI